MQDEGSCRMALYVLDDDLLGLVSELQIQHLRIKCLLLQVPDQLIVP